MAYYKLIALAFIVLVMLPANLADDDLDDGVPGVPGGDDDDDDLPRTPANPTLPPQTPTTPNLPPQTPTIPTLPPPLTPNTTLPSPQTPTTPTPPPPGDDDNDDGKGLPTPQTPIAGNICSAAECGKGQCVLNASLPLGYKCRCDSGWKKTYPGYDDDDRNDDRDDDLNDDDDDDKAYYPCVIPNCTLNFTCQAAPPPPVAPKQIPVNGSLNDPCYWTNCGEGTCVKATDSKTTCQCKPGYSNLMNISYFPCYNDCIYGNDCRPLGLGNSTTGGNNNGLSDGINTDNGSQGFLPGKFYWMGTLMAMALTMWH